jgi:hypothetical protein
MKHRFIVWGSGMARDHLIHAGENTTRAREVAEYFQQKYRQCSQDNFCSTLGPIHVTYWATWAVEAEAPCETINQAESFNRPGDA